MYTRRTGFTLIEVMVASTIGAFIMLVAVGTLRAITASTERVDRSISTAAEIRFASNLLARDLVNFYRDENIENTELIGTFTELGEGSTSYLVFYTVGRAKARIDQPESDIYEVEYYLTMNEDKSLLMRRLWPNPNKEIEPGGILTVIAEDIEVFQVRYYDGEEWSTEWPEEMEVLPQLIEVSIVAKSPTLGSPAMESFYVNFIRSATSTVSTSESSEQEQSSQQTGQGIGQQTGQGTGQQSGQGASQGSGPGTGSGAAR